EAPRRSEHLVAADGAAAADREERPHRRRASGEAVALHEVRRRTRPCPVDAEGVGGAGGKRPFDIAEGYRSRRPRAGAAVERVALEKIEGADLGRSGDGG